MPISKDFPHATNSNEFFIFYEIIRNDKDRTLLQAPHYGAIYPLDSSLGLLCFWLPYTAKGERFLEASNAVKFMALNRVISDNTDLSFLTATHFRAIYPLDRSLGHRF